MNQFLNRFAEPVFLKLLRSPGIDFQPGGPVRQPYCRTGPLGYIGWRNRFLGINSWAPETFTNTGSDIFLHSGFFLALKSINSLNFYAILIFNLHSISHFFSLLYRSRIHERTTSLRFLGIFLRVLRLEVSA
jgi:hypothetical protein